MTPLEREQVKGRLQFLSWFPGEGPAQGLLLRILEENDALLEALRVYADEAFWHRAVVTQNGHEVEVFCCTKSNPWSVAREALGEKP